MIIDLSHGRGWTEREINYRPDVTIDISRKKRPMIIADFSHLPLRSRISDLLILDPPFQVYGFGKKRSFVENYGSFRDLETSIRTLSSLFSECRRIMKKNGSLLLKWGTNHRPLVWIIGLSGMMNHRILLERQSLASSPEKPYSHRAKVFWVELF